MRRLLILTSMSLLVACNRGRQPDAYGTFEASEVVVSTQATGQLKSFTPAEGARLTRGEVVGLVDTVQLGLQREQLVAQREATQSHVTEIGQQINVLDVQRAIALRTYERTRRLFNQRAATAQQLDQAERDERVLANQIAAQEDQIKAHERQIAAQTDQVRAARAQEQTAAAQAAGAEAQVNQAGERIRKTGVRNPIDGTVLTTYAKAGEVVQAGQPLYRVADLKTMEVRAYVTEPQLSSIRLGQDARVSIDAGGGRRQTVNGAISWISSRAEFTPTPIQTRDERAGMVYALKIRVANDNGALKIGMPVDVQFVAPQAAR